MSCPFSTIEIQLDRTWSCNFAERLVSLPTQQITRIRASCVDRSPPETTDNSRILLTRDFSLQTTGVNLGIDLGTL